MCLGETGRKRGGERQTGRDTYCLMSFYKTLCVPSPSPFYEFIIKEWVNVTAESNRMGCCVQNEKPGERVGERGVRGEEIVGAPAMIGPIAQVVAGGSLSHVLSLLGDSHRKKGRSPGVSRSCL